MMTSRERLLCAISNGKPDRLPGQVHNWMPYYLNNYLDGMGPLEAYAKFGLDYAVYTGPEYTFDEKDLAKWQGKQIDLKTDPDGTSSWTEIYTTPEGDLRTTMASNPITTYTVEHMVKTHEDFELFRKYFPVPTGVNGKGVKDLRDQVGDRGIIRGIIWCYGQMGVWQSLCSLMGTQQAIMSAMDDPEWTHYALRSLLDQQMRPMHMLAGEVPFDLIELGGGAASNTVISPNFHREFCLPYDKQQVDILHAGGYKTVYHLCGGLMQMLDVVVENGTDGLETMTPAAMGGDCDLKEADRRVGDKLFFVGGFDQSQGFESGSPEVARKQVLELHASCPNGGYICCPSDHFFHGALENIQAFSDALRECVYD